MTTHVIPDWSALASAPPRALQGTDALDLDASTQCWLVLSGRVELYVRDRDALSSDGFEIASVGRRRRGLVGRRFLLARDAGTLLWSFDGQGDQAGVSLSGVSRDAVVVPLDGAQLLAAMLAGDDAVEHGIQEWLDATAGLVERGDGTGAWTELATETALEYQRFDILRPAHGVAWARAEEGPLLLLGREELRVTVGQSVPVTRVLWAQIGENPATIAARASGTVEPEVVLEALRWWHAGVLRAHLADAAADTALESDRLARRAEREAAELAGSLEALASAANEQAPAFVAPAGDDALVAACRLAAADTGLTLSRLPRAELAHQFRDPIQAIANASRLRVRSVTLSEGWWRGDHGTFVARDRADQPFVLRSLGRRYVAVDPLTGDTQVVDAALARRFQLTAYQFLPALPAGQIGARALWQIGVRPVVRDLVGIGLLALAVAMLAALSPLVTRLVFDEIIPQAAVSQLSLIALVLISAATSRTLLNQAKRRLVLRAEGVMAYRLEASVLDRLLRLPMRFFKRYLAADLAARAAAIGAIRAELSGRALSSVLDGIFSITSLAVLLTLDARLAAVGGALALVAVAVIVGSSWIAVSAERDIAQQDGHLSGMLLQLLSAIPKIRVAGAERRVFALWATLFARLRERHVGALRVQQGFGLFLQAFPVLSTLAFYAVMTAHLRESMSRPGGTADGSGVSLGVFVAAMAAYAQFTTAVLGLGSTVLSVLAVLPQWERLRPILQEPEECPPEAADPGVLQGRVSLRRVSYRYDVDGPLVLDDVSLDAAPGELIAIVGPSGSGKSTLLRLLLGLDQPEAGAVFFDGQDLSALDASAVRRQIGVVIQSGTVMPGDIKSNILGPWNRTLADAWRAAELAGLADDIQAMPMGMHTVIGEGNSTFSGGQLQRLLLARALVHEPRILVLDEATSALDNRTQAHVAASLDAMSVTRIVIAHRLSTIQQADRIYVLEGGRMVEQGTFASLLAANGTFAKLARRQML